MKPKRTVGDHIPTRKYALALAKGYGCSVVTGRGGEVIVTAPDGARAVLSNRRKDASLALIQLIRRIEPKG